MFDKKAYNKAYREAHRDQLNQYYRNWHSQHKESENAKCREYQRQHGTEIYRKKKPYLERYHTEHAEEEKMYFQQYRETNREALREDGIERKRRVKTEVLTHYGNGKLACVKCGFDNLAALSIDHINGNGTQHRKALGPTTYRWLQTNGYPEGYQTLCMNCQFIKAEENKERFKPHLKNRQSEEK